MPTYTLGAVRITSITEVVLPVPAAGLVPDAKPEAIADLDWLRPHYVEPDGALRIHIQALLVESQGRRIVVDTCVGNDKQRTLPAFHEMHTDFLGDLARAGFARELVDTVVCTHLHVDHVGWNTMRVAAGPGTWRWVPTFPNARYLVARAEWEHWSRTPDTSFGDVLGDSVRPLFDAGLVDLVEPGHRVTEEVTLIPTPGHTPGHVSVRIASEGAEAVITGDLMHHPAQIAHPEWASSADVDAEAARATRRAFLDANADAPVLVIGTHFARPSGGRIVRDGGRLRFEPMK